MARLPAAYQAKTDQQQTATGMSGLPVETGPGLGRTIGGLGVDVVGGGLSSAAGYALAPFTFGISIPVLAIGGGMASNYAAQKIEGEGFSIGRMVASGLLNLIPGAGKLAATTTGKIAARPLAEFARKEAIRGGGIAMGEKAVQTIIDEQRFPTFDEFVQSGAIGTVFGGALGTGIGVAAQKGLFDKLGGRTIDEVENSLPDPKERKEVKDVIMGQEVDKTDVFKDVIGTRSQFFRDGLTERLDTRQVAMSNQVYNAINRDLSKAMRSEDASLILDRFINAASDKRNKDVDDRIMLGREKGTVYPDLASINSLGGARPFNNADGPQAKAFKNAY